MKLQKINCPNCSGTLDMKINPKSEFIFCPYCGQQIHIDNGKIEYTITKNININKNINHTKRTIDDADVIRAKNEGMDNKIVVFIMLFFFIVGFGGLFLGWGLEEIETKKAIEAGKICAGSDEDYIDSDYEAAVEQLKALGFTNITTVDSDSAGLAFWNSNKVESVSINGETNFSSVDYFEPDSAVVVKYK